MDLLNENSPVPLYHQLAKKIKKKIEDGEWHINALVPSEKELCDKYKISRGTVRQAMFELIREGLIYRKPGQGTFVTKLKIIQPVNRFYSFDQDILEKGFEPSQKIMEKKIVRPNKIIKEIMKLKEGEKIYKIVRIKFASEEPVLLDISYLSIEQFPELYKEDFKNIPLYKILIDKYNLRMSRVKDTYEPILINRLNARKLNSPVGTLALLAKRVSYSYGKIFEFRKTIIRTDKCNYSVELI